MSHFSGNPTNQELTVHCIDGKPELNFLPAGSGSSQQLDLRLSPPVGGRYGQALENQGEHLFERTRRVGLSVVAVSIRLDHIYDGQMARSGRREGAQGPTASHRTSIHQHIGRSGAAGS
jgi:hypothetical protein